MSLKKLQHLLFVTVFSFPFIVSAQSGEPYTLQELSNAFYNKQKDSIKKNWICPVLFKEKETQKKYKESWDSRTDFIVDALAAKNFVHDNEVYNYIDGILQEIVKSNTQLIPVKPLLLIDRSASVNAYTIGGNMIAVNAGLITFAREREEIALVVAHEIAHNILSHADNSMKERAVWFTSAEYKKSLESVLDSKYERLTRLKKIFEGYSFSRSRHNRYHEGEADSLAIVLLKNSHISFNPAYFLRLDSADIQYKQPLKNPVKKYFESYNLVLEDAWFQKRSRGLSTKTYNFKDTTRLTDSVKTHPECKERYEKTLTLATSPLKGSAIPNGIKESATKILIWNMFNNQVITPCLYRLLLEKDEGNKDEWYDFMIHNAFAALYYADKQLNRFNAISVIQKEYISKDYYELQTMLEQIPRENLEQLAKQLQNAPFWKNMPADRKAIKGFFSVLNIEADGSKAIGRSAKDFIDTYPTSMYCELAEHFKK